MALDIVNLGFAVDASQLERARAGLDGLGSSSKRTASSMAAAQGKITGSISRVRWAMASLGGVATAVSASSYVRMADEWTDLSSRVGLAVGNMEEAQGVMKRLGQMADRTYTDISLTASGWLENSTALRELGLTTEQSLDFMESFNNAMVVSGAKGDRAAMVMNALSKSMALGKLSGDQLNTILASGGRVAELLAEELGTTTTGLRAMGAQGKITSEVIDNALRGNMVKLRGEADSMQATVGDGFLRIRNAVFRTVGTFDQATGATAKLADNLVRLSEGMTAMLDGAEGAPGVINQFATTTDRLGTALSGLTGGDVEESRRAFMDFIADAQDGANRLVSAAPQAEVSIVRLRGALDSLAAGDYTTAGASIRDFLTDAVDGIDRLINLAFGDGAAAKARQWVDDTVASVARLPGEAVRQIGQLAAALGGGMSSIASQAVGWANSIVQNIISGLGGLYQAAVAAIADLARGFRESVGGLISEAKEWGANIGAGIVSGLAGARDRVVGAVKGLAGAVKNTFTGETEIQSPSRVFMRFGQWLAEGLGIGIDNGTGGAVDAVASMADRTIGAAEQFRSGIQDAFGSVINGTKKVPEAIRDMLSNILGQLASSGLDRALNALFGAFTGGDPMTAALKAAGAPVPSFAGGGFTGRGSRIGGVDGLGGFPAILHRNETVVDHTRPGSGAGGNINVHVTVSMDETGNLMVRNIAKQESSRMAAGINASLPGRVAQIKRDPRLR